MPTIDNKYFLKNIKMKEFLFLLLSLGLNLTVLGQNYSKKELNYKPKNLIEAVHQLIKIHNDSIKNNITKLSEKEYMKKYYMSLGYQIRNNWKLWKKRSDIVKYFNSLEIYDPDEMSGIILKSYYRELKHEDWLLDEQLKYYKSKIK
jgi:hypothetical protein